jgi:WD40 repeat protein
MRHSLSLVLAVSFLYCIAGMARTFVPPGPEQRFGLTAVSPDGKFLAANLLKPPRETRFFGGWDNAGLAIYDAATAKLIQHVPDDVDWRPVFSPDGTCLAGGKLYGPLHVWKVSPDGSLTKVLKYPLVRVFSYAFSPDSSVLSAADLRQAALIDTRTWKEIDRVGALNGYSLAFSPDGGKLLMASRDYEPIQAWDLKTHEVTRYLNARGYRGQTWKIAFAPDGKVFATGQIVEKNREYDYVLTLWDAATGKELSRIDTDGTPFEAGFSPNGRFVLMTVGIYDKVQLWDRKEGRIAFTAEDKIPAFSPDWSTVYLSKYMEPKIESAPSAEWLKGVEISSLTAPW